MYVRHGGACDPLWCLCNSASKPGQKTEYQTGIRKRLILWLRISRKSNLRLKLRLVDDLFWVYPAIRTGIIRV